MELPDWLWEVSYNGEQGPDGDIRHGANCQLFAYEVLRHFGIAVPPLHSSELWEDTTATTKADDPQPLDLVLFSKDEAVYGAHVGVVWADDEVLHLCKEVGRPAVWSWQDFADRPRYAVRHGFKRPVRRGSSETPSSRL